MPKQILEVLDRYEYETKQAYGELCANFDAYSAGGRLLQVARALREATAGLRSIFENTEESFDREMASDTLDAIKEILTGEE